MIIDGYMQCRSYESTAYSRRMHQNTGEYGVCRSGLVFRLEVVHSLVLGTGLRSVPLRSPILISMVNKTTI